jgi:pimeloyl-ACP methyl ester carboxylesterase
MYSWSNTPASFKIGGITEWQCIPSGYHRQGKHTTYWKRGTGTELVMLMHPYNSDAKGLRHIAKVVAAARQDAERQPDLLIPEFPAEILSTANPLHIVRKLVKLLDWLYQERQYTNIMFVGHSLGSVLARKIYVCACGETPRAPFEPELAEIAQPEPRAWADKVSRIILLAGITRGWQNTYHMSFQELLIRQLGDVVGGAMAMTGNIPFIWQFRRGAPFMTQLRIQWLAMQQRDRQQAEHGQGQSQVRQLLTIQLLGSKDDIVSPEDNIDQVTGREFIYIDVPYSGHADIADMGFDLESETTRQKREAAERKNPALKAARVKEVSKRSGRAEKLTLALNADLERLQQEEVLPYEQHFPDPDFAIRHVVFVIHGIRDKGYWTNKIARRTQALGNRVWREQHSSNSPTHRENVYAIEVSTYGYFPLLSFLIPFRRRDKMEWLMDQYTEDMALYPNADFHYVGHSNGTFLLARALKEYPCCQFKNVVFAGSVVPIWYDWKTRFQQGQVERVLNFVATHDWVVAIFPKLFQNALFKWQELGSAGHDGFLKLSSPNKNLSESRSYLTKSILQNDQGKPLGEIYEVTYIQGDHGAALVEDNWETISNFIVHGKLEGAQLIPPEDSSMDAISGSSPSLFVNQQKWWTVALGTMPVVVWLAILFLLIAIGTGLLLTGWPQWLKTALFIGYLWVIWRVLTRL